MSRVDDLHRRCPSIPRDVILKTDVLMLGIRDSEVLYKVGRWNRSAGQGGYGSFDRDVTRKEVAEKRPGTASKPGYIRNLDGFYMANGLGVRIDRDSLSPYKIRELDCGKYGLFEGEEKVEDVYFPHEPWPYPEREEPLTTSGKPITTLVNLRSPNCFRIALVRHCEYFSTGEQCKFCNYNPSQEDVRSVGGMRSITIGLEEAVEAYKILSSEVRLIEGNFMQGALANLDRDTDIHLRLLEKIASAASYKPVLSIIAQPPRGRKGFQRMKDAGLDFFLSDIEVWDPELFVEICPGKAKHVGYERYREAYLEAVDVFGWGQVGGVIIQGATLMPANGHKTWQESRDLVNEGVRWLAKNGVMPYLSQIRWAPGSEFSKDPSGRDRLPPTEYLLDNILVHHEAMKENGIYEKMNRFMACTMDCLPNHYFAELGMLEMTGGNYASWLAPLIPDEVNWLARFVGSVNKTPAKAYTSR